MSGLSDDAKTIRETYRTKWSGEIARFMMAFAQIVHSRTGTSKRPRSQRPLGPAPAVPLLRNKVYGLEASSKPAPANLPKLIHERPSCS